MSAQNSGHFLCPRTRTCISRSKLHLKVLLRVPWYIVVIGILGSIYGTWFAGTRHYDFMSPRGAVLPPEDFGADLVSGIPKVTPLVLPPPKPLKEEPEILENLRIEETDLGNLEHAPGLAEYRDFARQEGPARTLDLSSRLQTLGQSQRALLALERVIDSTISNPSETAQAAAGIRALSKELPHWAIDPSTEITLTLHLTCAGKVPAHLKKAALDVATQIREASSLQLEVIPKISSGRREDAAQSIALQLTAGGDGPVLTLNSLSHEASSTTDELAKILFRMVRLQLSDLGYAVPDDASPRDLSEGMTRLMWRDYAATLVPKRSSPPSLPPRAKKSERLKEID